MKKNTVLRNESPHAVKVQAGSNVAEHKSRKVAGVKEPAAKAKVEAKVSPPPEEATPAPAKAPKRTPAKPRAKVRLKTPEAQPRVDAIKLPEPSLDKPVVTAPPVLDEADLWEQESTVKNRLAKLKTRNSLLSEQLQRLKTPIKARGKKS